MVVRMDIITLKNVVVFFKHSSPLLRIDLKSHTGTITGVYSLIYIKSWTKGKSWIVELKKIIKLKMKVYQQKKNIRKKNLHFHAQWALNICAVDGNLICFTHFRHIFFFVCLATWIIVLGVSTVFIGTSEIECVCIFIIFFVSRSSSVFISSWIECIWD